MLSQVAKASIRRHLEYGAAAYKPHAGRMSTGIWPLNNVELEQRLDELAPVDEAALTGDYVGSLQVVTAPGDTDTLTLTVTADVLTDGPEEVIVIADETDTVKSIAFKLAAAINGNANLKSAGFQSHPIQESAEIQMRCPSEFVLSLDFTGAVSAVISLDGQRVKPDAIVGAEAGQLIIKYGYIAILDFLESAQAGTTDNLDTAKADVWTHNAEEIKDRAALYRQWQKKLSNYLDVPINPSASQGYGNRVVI